MGRLPLIIDVVGAESAQEVHAVVRELLGVALEARATPWVFFLHLAENGALAPDGRSLYQDAAALGVIFVGVKAALWASNFVNSRRPMA